MADIMLARLNNIDGLASVEYNLMVCSKARSASQPFLFSQVMFYTFVFFFVCLFVVCDN